MSNRRIVVLDACVLYPAPLRDLLMHLLLAGFYQAKWSVQIQEEWINALLRERHDLNREQLERTSYLMNQVSPDSQVEEFDGIIPGIVGLPDPNDAHVIAVGIKAEADTILTFNLKHFPSSVFDQHGLEVLTPDEFLSELLEQNLQAVCDVMKIHRASLKNPPKTVAEYIETLSLQRLTESIKLIGGSEYLI